MSKRHKPTCYPLQAIRSLSNQEMEYFKLCKTVDDPLVQVDFYGFAFELSKVRQQALSEIIQQAVELCRLAAWNIEKQIFTFSGELYDDLILSENEVKIPAEIFHSLPAKSFYVEVPDRNVEFFVQWQNGAFVDEEKELFISKRIDKTDNFRSIVFKISPGKTVRECIEETDDDTWTKCGGPKVRTRDEDKVFAAKAVQLLLYLCSDKPDVNVTQEPKSRPHRENSNTNIKYTDIKNVSVGVRYRDWKRAAVKYANYDSGHEAGTGRTVIPHIRHGHWHSFWTGKKSSDNRKLIIKWIPPIFVNGKLVDGKNDGITINEVK